MTQPAYILPNPKPLVNETAPLTLNQFLQTVLVGLSDLQGQFVRPNWQQEPPKQPDIDVDWLAFGIANSTPDANAFVGTDGAGNTSLTRQELLEVACSIYGPNALELSGLIRDGFQIDQNRWALKTAKMGYAYSGDTQHIPDLLNERWYNRVTFSFFLRRQVQRNYPILTIVSANGSIFSTGNDVLTTPWLVQA